MFRQSIFLIFVIMLLVCTILNCGKSSSDSTALDLSSEVSIPAEIEQVGSGSGNIILQGTVLTPSGIINNGEVLIVGNIITYVGKNASGQVGGDTATIINTNGIISPGLIDCNNRLNYSIFTDFIPASSVNNRYDVLSDTGYEEHILPINAHRSSNSHFVPSFDWGQIRSIINGTTTVQGGPIASGSGINWGVRNANRYHDLGYDFMIYRTTSVRNIDDLFADSIKARVDDSTEPITRYVVNMAEGVSGNNITEEFDSFAGRDPRTNSHQGVTLLYKESSVLLNCIALTNSQLSEVASTNSKIVWSPSSNIALYGTTADIKTILSKGITVGLGPDSPMFGEDDLLSELRYAFYWGIDNDVSALTPKKLWEMVTSDGAKVLGLSGYIGSIEVGKRADIVVFGRVGANPYWNVIKCEPQDVRLVLIDGVGYYGDSSLKDTFQRNDFSETIDVNGVSKFICVKEDAGDDGLAETETLLYNILEGVGYPAEEQYGRGDELNPLY